MSKQPFSSNSPQNNTLCIPRWSWTSKFYESDILTTVSQVSLKHPQNSSLHKELLYLAQFYSKLLLHNMKIIKNFTNFSPPLKSGTTSIHFYCRSSCKSQVIRTCSSPNPVSVSESAFLLSSGLLEKCYGRLGHSKV